MHCFVCVFLAFVFVTGALAQGVTVVFQPPTGAFLEVLTEMQRTRTTPAGTRDTSAKVKAYIAVQKDEGGYAYRLKVRDVAVTVDGKPTENPLATALFALDATTHYDEDGELTDITGIDKAIETILAPLPEQVQAQVRQLLSKEAMVAKESANWNSMFAMLVGKSLQVGMQWEEPTTFELPMGGVMEYDAKHQVTELVDCGQKLRCLRVVSESVGRTDDYADEMRALMDGTLDVGELVGASLETHATFDRVLHPETGLLYEEKLVSETVTTVELKKEGKSSVRQGEKRHATYRILQGEERAAASASFADPVAP